jgi:hypothetical protein
MDSLDGVYWTEWFDRDDPPSGTGDNELRFVQEDVNDLVCGGNALVYEYEKIGVGGCWDEGLGSFTGRQMTELNNDPETCFQGSRSL